ncbi:hypothetical protein RI367_005085 [Sorochytrium milnesiophthora]
MPPPSLSNQLVALVDEPTPEAPKCQLLDNFAVGVQLVLATVALSSLLVKRHRERPRRPFLVWFYDASKQAFGASFVHGLNVLISLLAGSASESHTRNPCVWYFLNVAIDCTLGVYLLFLWLRLAARLVVTLQLDDLESGYYGDPPRVLAWIKQTILFSWCLFLVKICVVLLLRFLPFLGAVGKWVLSPFGNARGEVVFVMLVFPLIMNVMQFWLVDTVIKRKEPGITSDGVLPSEEDLAGDSSVFQQTHDHSVRASVDSNLSDSSLLTTMMDDGDRPADPRNVRSIFPKRSTDRSQSRTSTTGVVEKRDKRSRKAHGESYISLDIDSPREMASRQASFDGGQMPMVPAASSSSASPPAAAASLTPSSPTRLTPSPH